MSNNYSIEYEELLRSVEDSINESLTEMSYLNDQSFQALTKCESSLDAWDYCYSIAIGLAGTFITTNESFGIYLDQIHKASSGASGEYDRFQAFLGRLLHHEGDNIDAIEYPFKNRNGGNAYCIFHRLLWGHDILSVKEDNPFFLMFKQQGIKGILQAVRHLLADTASKQGLPFPGSSFLDFVDEDNKTSNYLIKIAQQLSEESTGLKTNAQEIYAHMMTVRAQDVTAGVVVRIVTDLYFKMRQIRNDTRCAEIRLIAYAVNFFGEAVFGSIKQNGIPYINLPLASATVGAFTGFCRCNYKELRELTTKTTQLCETIDSISKSEEESILTLPVRKTVDDYLAAEEMAENNFEELLDSWGEELD